MPTRTGLLGLLLALLGVSAAAQGAPPSMAFNLHLHCAGHMIAPSPPGPAGAPAAAPAVDEIFVDIDGDQGRIRLPAPPGVVGGRWRPIVDLLVDESQVTGRIALDPWTFWSRPLMRVDRVSGGVDLKGPRGLGFHGDCAAYEASELQKF